ncbi:hypothetical protein [Bounagaea algeriensis]
MSTGPFPYLSFILVSPPLEQKIKSSCTAGAVPSLATAPIIGLIVLFLDGDLLFVKLLQGLCALFLLASGFYLLAGRSCVASGHLNLTIAAQVRRPLLALTIVEAVLLLLSYVPLLVHLTEATEVSSTSVVIGMLLPAVLFGLSLMNYRVARKLLPPRPAMLQQHGLSGQVVGPPPHPADRTGER